MIERATAGALGVLVAGLAIAALAHQPRAKQLPSPPRTPLGTAASPAAIGALREGVPLDLNLASVADLELLPGIGPALAQRIVEARGKNGAFSRVEELLAVRGIGPATLKRLQPLVSVQPGIGQGAPSSLVEQKDR